MAGAPPGGRALSGGEAPPGGGGDGRADFDAVILAGGRGTRLGGADKPGLTVGSSTMAASVASAAVAAGAGRVVLVGPPRADLALICAPLPGGLTVVREEPPGAGPVPALRAGLTRVRAPWVALLAADLPFLLGADISSLLAATRGPSAGVVLADAEGAPQWLAGCWQTASLRAALLEYRGSSLRSLLGPLRPALIGPAAMPSREPPPWLDCDTPAELAAARLWRAGQARDPEPGRARAPDPS